MPSTLLTITKPGIPEGRLLRRSATTLSAPPGDPSLPPRTGEEVRTVHVPLGAGLATRGAGSGDLSLVLTDLEDLRVGLLDQPLALLVSQLADDDGVPEHTAVDADGRSLDVAQDADRGLERPVVLLVDTKMLDVDPLFARYIGCVVHVHFPCGSRGWDRITIPPLVYLDNIRFFCCYI